MRISRVVLCAVVLLAGLVGFALPHPAGAATNHPVVYNISAARGVLSDPTAPPPGANDFRCKPTSAHPRPVVLVHGLGANMGEN
jgi:hypothetical protein